MRTILGESALPTRFHKCRCHSNSFEYNSCAKRVLVFGVLLMLGLVQSERLYASGVNSPVSNCLRLQDISPSLWSLSSALPGVISRIEIILLFGAMAFLFSLFLALINCAILSFKGSARVGKLSFVLFALLTVGSFSFAFAQNYYLHNHNVTGSVLGASDSADPFLIMGGDGIRNLVRFSTQTGENVGQSVTYGGIIRDSVIVGDHVYVAGEGDQTIKKYSLHDFSYVAESVPFGGQIYALEVAGDYIYAGGADYINGLIRQYRLDDLTFTGVASPLYGGNIYSLVIDGDYIYAGGTIVRNVKKYRLDDLTYTGVQSPIFGGTIRVMIIEGGDIYVGGVTTWTVRKYDAETLVYLGETPSYGGIVYTLDIQGGYLYAGGSQGVLKKYDLNDLSYVLEGPAYGGTIYASVVVGDYIYIGGAITQRVRQYSLFDLSYTGFQSASYGGNIWSLLLDPNIYGCTDSEALNFNSFANVDNGTCDYVVPFQVYNVEQDVYYSKIQEGIDSALDFETLVLSESLYEENLVITKSLNIIGLGADSTTIRGVANDENIVRIRGDVQEYITVSLKGVTLDHQNLGATTQFGSVYGINAMYTDGLVLDDIRAINFGNDLQYERGGFGVYNSLNATLTNLEVDNVRGSFASGFRIHGSDNVLVRDVNVRNIYNAHGLNMWIMYIHTVTNSEFHNVFGDNLVGQGASTPIPWSITSSHNNLFENFTIQNVSGAESTVGIKLQYSSQNTFKNILIENMEGTMIVGGLDITHGYDGVGYLKDNVFEDVVIRNLHGGVQTRGINLDRGVENGVFRNITIENLKGYKTGVTQFSVMGINLNSRDPNPSTLGNVFEDVTISGIDTTGKFFGINVNSLTSNAYTKDNTFENIEIILDESDFFEESYGYHDTSDCGNFLKNSTLMGLDYGVFTNKVGCVMLENNVFKKNLNVLRENADISDFLTLYNTNYFDYASYVATDGAVFGNLRVTFNDRFFDLDDMQNVFAKENVYIKVRDGSRKASLVISQGTAVSHTSGEDLDIGGLDTEILNYSHNIDGNESAFLFKFGHEALEIEFDQEVGVDFYVGGDLEGDRLKIYRSLDESGWVRVEDCIVTDGTCSFTTSKASYFALVGYGSHTVTYLADDNGSILGEGIQLIPHGLSSDIVQAVPSVGYEFFQWNDGVQTDFRMEAEVLEDATYTAYFTLLDHEISVSPSVGGVVNGAGLYLYGSNASLSAVPSVGYEFLGWYIDGELISNSSVYSFRVDSDMHFDARFSLKMYRVDISSRGNGIASGSGTYSHGKSVTISVVPGADSTFLGWEENGKFISFQNSYRFTVTSNRNITAVFDFTPVRVLPQEVFSISSTSGDNGSINPAGDLIFNAGAFQTFTVVPNPGYQVLSVFVDGVNQGRILNYTFNLILGNHTIHADFELIALVEAEEVIDNQTEVFPVLLTEDFSEIFNTLEPVVQEQNVRFLPLTLDNDVLEVGTLVVSAALIPLTAISLISGQFAMFYSVLQTLLGAFGIFGLRKRSKVYAVIYDSVTKEPIGNVLVRVYDTSGKLVKTELTDSSGIFASSLTNGEYVVNVSGRGFAFPSSVVTSKTDGSYRYIYRGGIFPVQNSSRKIYSIPLDPLESNKLIYARALLINRLSNFASLIQYFLIILGFLFSMTLYLRFPSILNLTILSLYLVFVFFIFIHLLQRYNVQKE